MDGQGFPIVAALSNHHPERTVFTRFVPPERTDKMPGVCQRYYTRRRNATRERLDLQLLELMPPLVALFACRQLCWTRLISATASSWCSSSDEGHDVLMRLYHTRYAEQIETADAAAILARWE